MNAPTEKWYAAALQRKPKNALELKLHLLEIGTPQGIVNLAVSDAQEGKDVTECFKKALETDKKAQDYYVDKALKPWANRHGLTLQQAVSIAFNDHEFNPNSKVDDLPTLRGLFWESGVQNTYLMRLDKELENSGEVSAQRAREILNRQYRDGFNEPITERLSKALHALPACNLMALIGDAMQEIDVLQAQVQALKSENDQLKGARDAA